MVDIPARSPHRLKEQRDIVLQNERENIMNVEGSKQEWILKGKCKIKGHILSTQKEAAGIS